MIKWIVIALVVAFPLVAVDAFAYTVTIAHNVVVAAINAVI